jgi:recombination protein RecT
MNEQKAPTNTPAPTAPQNQLAMLKKDTADIVAARVRQFQESGEINLPDNYSVENAMKSAWLILQGVQDRNFKPALSVCTKDSIANSLLDMVVQGLNPAKKQGYFIVYGDKLAFQRSYFGTMAVAMQVDDSIAEIVPEVVYEGDKFAYKIVRGKKEISVHEQALENINGGKLKAAYCLIINHDGEIIKTEIMTIDEIKKAWAQSQMKPIDEKGMIKPGSTHEKFTADMAKKTVINRACKPIINASNDSYLFRKSVNRSSEIKTDEEVAAEIAENANGEMLQINESALDAEFTAEELGATTEQKTPDKAPAAKTGKGPNF